MKLSDTQAILLTIAAQRGSGSLYPLPDTLMSKAGAAKSITALIKHGLVAERETSDAAAASRTDGDQRYGIFITPAGLTAIGVTADESGDIDPPAPEAPPRAAPEPRATKAALVLSLLRRDDGATLAELIEATGWLPHTTRAALTGLRKKGHTVEKSKRDGVTCYSVAAA